MSSAAQDEQWAKFDAKTGTISMKDIPFPNKRTLARDAKNKEQYKKLAMRWHPDKFQQKYGARLAASEKEKITARVVETFQIISASH